MMTRLGFYFDMMKCIGCRACQVACKDRNKLDVGTVFRNAHTYSTGTFPAVKCYSYSGTCYHCENPACVAACSAGAMYVADDGTVQHDDTKCIGCGSCVQACPYGNPKIIPETGLAGKCDSCKDIRDAHGNPVCVDACPMRALDFGDLDELTAKYGGELVSDIAILPDSSVTKPRLLINAKEAALDGSYREMFY